MPDVVIEQHQLPLPVWLTEMGRTEHWQRAYTDKPSDQVGWYRPHLELSLAWIAELGLDKSSEIIDVGINNLRRALRAGGHLIIGVFALEAPPRCSGLEVRRYDLEQLQAEFGSESVLKEQRKDLHVTPGGVEQMYLYSRFEKLP